MVLTFLGLSPITFTIFTKKIQRMIESHTIEKKKTARQQIKDYLRDAILTGELKAGK